MTRMRCLLLLVFAWAVLLGSSQGQTPSPAPASPAQLAAEYFRLLQKEDYKAAATYFDDASLKDFRDRWGFFGELPEELAREVYPQFFGEGQTKESVAAMTDAAFFAHWLGFFQAQAKACGKVALDNWKYLGEVPEGEDTVHVLTRSRAQVGEQEFDGVVAMTFRKVNGQWKYSVPGEMLALPALLRAELQASNPPEMQAMPLRVVPEREKAEN